MNDLPSTEEMLNLLEEQDKKISEQSQKMIKLQSLNSELQDQVNKLLNLQNEDLQREKELKNLNSKLKESQERGRQLERLIEEGKDKLVQAEKRVQYRDVTKITYKEKCKECKKEILQKKLYAYKSSVIVLGLITLVTTVLSIIRQKTFCDDFRTFWIETYKSSLNIIKAVNDTIMKLSEVSEKIHNQMAEGIVKWFIIILIRGVLIALIVFVIRWIIENLVEKVIEGVKGWNFSLSVLFLLAAVYFGDYIKNLVKFNLMGMWIIVAIGLLLVGIWEESYFQERY